MSNKFLKKGGDMYKKGKAAGAAENMYHKDTENINSVSLFGKKWYSKEDFRRKYQLSEYRLHSLLAYGRVRLAFDETGVEVFRWERRWK